MAQSSSKPFLGLLVLVLAPVCLLSVIAVIGLGSQRSAIEEDARREMGHWVSEDRVARLLEDLAKDGQERPSVVAFPEIPPGQLEKSPGERRLENALVESDLEALRRLMESEELTAAGLPVSVLAGWKVYEKTADPDDRAALLFLVIHGRPSVISELVVERVAPQTDAPLAWEREWALSQERRRLLTEAKEQSGFIESTKGPFWRQGDKVMTPAELQRFLQDHEGKEVRPAWMQIDYVVKGESLLAEVEDPLLEAGGDLRLVAGVRDPRVLFKRFWESIWWVLAIIACALLTAMVGMWQIRRALFRERRLHEMKGQFVASVSHELRTPVASMRLMADVLHAGKISEEKAHEFHELMSQEGARLTAMIENVLDFSRIEEGRKRYHLKPTALSELVKDVIRLMEPLARERMVLLECQQDALPADLLLDGGAMQQVLVNLLDNAIKFSPEGAQVKILVKRMRKGWQMVVSDQGPGVPAEKREMIFERFVRLEDELRRESKGAGIGLAVVKHAVEAHGGTVNVQRGPQGGAEFVVTCGAGELKEREPEHSEGKLSAKRPDEPIAEGGS